MRRAVLSVLVLTMALTVWVIAGCSSDTTAPEPAGEGRMIVNLVDAPGDYEEVNIEFIQVAVRMDVDDTTSGWSIIAVDTTQANLLELTNGNYTVLADSTVPAGHYTEVRLLLSENNTVKVDGEYHELIVPSGYTSGLKLKHEFDIETDVAYSITLDFDAERSIVKTGNGTYKLKPVINIMVDAVSGSIEGTVLPVDARAMILTTAGEDTFVTYADTLTGLFMFPVLMAGSYDLEISPTAGAYGDTVITGVPVAAQQITEIGTVELP